MCFRLIIWGLFSVGIAIVNAKANDLGSFSSTYPVIEKDPIELINHNLRNGEYDTDLIKKIGVDSVKNPKPVANIGEVTEARSI